MSGIEEFVEQLVYEHLVDLVDFDRIAALEQVLALQLAELHARGELGEVDRDEAQRRATAIFERAWQRMLADPRRTGELRTTWQPEADCELCRLLAGATDPQ